MRTTLGIDEKVMAQLKREAGGSPACRRWLEASHAALGMVRGLVDRLPVPSRHHPLARDPVPWDP